MTNPSPTATRARRYRQRKGAGRIIVQAELSPKALEALFDLGCIADKADMADREKVGEAVDLLLFAMAEGAVEIDYDQLD